MNLLIIADDLTGANDTAVQFANARNTATLLNLSGNLDLEEYDAVAVSSETRAVNQEEAYQMVRTLCKKFAMDNQIRVFKKIDSSLRGHIGVEIEALLDEFDFDMALVVPAYPANGRITSGAFHLINQVPVGESDVRNDPVTPIRESHLVKLLEKQIQRKTGYLSLETISNGWQAVLDEIHRQYNNGAKVIACDATTDDHLVTLARSLMKLRKALACGTAGLARAIAGLEGQITDGKLQLQEQRSDDGGVLGICGSQSAAARNQVEYARTIEGLDVIAINPTQFIHSDCLNKEVSRVTAQADEFLKRGHNVLIYVGGCSDGICVGNNLKTAILAALASVTRQLISRNKVRGLVLTGGDTAMAVCRSLNVQRIAIESEVFPGIVKSRLLGGLIPEGILITKSGSFGARDIIARLFDYV
jgi:uncharacterized protein YgbK (DUF1537 family)